MGRAQRAQGSERRGGPLNRASARDRVRQDKPPQAGPKRSRGGTLAKPKRATARAKPAKPKPPEAKSKLERLPPRKSTSVELQNP